MKWKYNKNIVDEEQFSTANSVNSRGCVTLSRERRPTPDKKRESIRFANSSRTFDTIERSWERGRGGRGGEIERGHHIWKWKMNRLMISIYRTEYWKILSRNGESSSPHRYAYIYIGYKFSVLILKCDIYSR